MEATKTTEPPKEVKKEEFPTYVRPKRKYTKAKDRLKGIVVSHETIKVRFD